MDRRVLAVLANEDGGGAARVIFMPPVRCGGCYGFLPAPRCFPRALGERCPKAPARQRGLTILKPLLGEGTAGWQLSRSTFIADVVIASSGEGVFDHLDVRDGPQLAA